MGRSWRRAIGGVILLILSLVALATWGMLQVFGEVDAAYSFTHQVDDPGLPWLNIQVVWPKYESRTSAEFWSADVVRLDVRAESHHSYRYLEKEGWSKLQCWIMENVNIELVISDGDTDLTERISGVAQSMGWVKRRLFEVVRQEVVSGG